jgi:hypothetical protein
VDKSLDLMRETKTGQAKITNYELYFLIVLIILLISYLFYFKEKLIKWKKEIPLKSYSNILTATLVAGIFYGYIKLWLLSNFINTF